MPQPVRPKKHLGQHFLKDHNIARNIVGSLSGFGNYHAVLEVGPGTGILSDFLFEEKKWDMHLVDVDRESIQFLQEKYPDHAERISYGDFLKMELPGDIPVPFAVVGNFPYNISSQIFFRVLEMRNDIPEVVGMIQKEVAERIASPSGNKVYGILSVLIQAFYNVELLFHVKPGVFHPPPKVMSSVIRLQRNERMALECDEKLFFRVVKQGFQNRRKTLRNALKPINLPDQIAAEPGLQRRAEQLDVEDFIELTRKIEECQTN